jgi:hypothetical protein
MFFFCFFKFILKIILQIFICKMWSQFPIIPFYFLIVIPKFFLFFSKKNWVYKLDIIYAIREKYSIFLDINQPYLSNYLTLI